MSKILEIQERLQDTNAAIAQMEKAAVADPSSPSIGAMRMSLEKRLRTLETEFMEGLQQVAMKKLRAILDPILKHSWQATVTISQSEVSLIQLQKGDCSREGFMLLLADDERLDRIAVYDDEEYPLALARTMVELAFELDDEFKDSI